MSPSAATKLETKALKNLAAELGAEVIGQSHAVTPVAEWVIDGELGLNLKGKPRGSFLLLGPTGVGKTQLCKALARRLAAGSQPVTFDMSEFKTAASVDVFLGKGAGDNGRFGRELGRNASSRVLLLDEIEKAHPDLQDLFLQVLDEGRLTVASGQKFDLRSHYIAFTSNMGGAAAARMRHNSDVAIERMMISTARRMVRPEWFARVDLVLCFKRLSLQVQEQVCRLHVDRKLAELGADGFDVKVEPSVYQWLLGEGFTELDGARPLVRAIQRHINRPIREAWANGEPASGVLRVNAAESALEFVRSADAAA